MCIRDRACIIYIAVTFSVIMLITDLVYAFVDPRIKAQYMHRSKKASTSPVSYTHLDGQQSRIPYAGFLVSDVTGFQGSLCGGPRGDGRQNLPEQGTLSLIHISPAA